MILSAREAIEEEIKSFLLLNENITLSKKNKHKHNFWFSVSGKSLRFSDLGFDIYSKIHQPFSLELRLFMTSRMLLEMDRAFQRKPWYLQRKYKPVQGSSHPPMIFIINHWSEEMNTGWVLSGENWETWLTISS